LTSSQTTLKKIFIQLLRVAIPVLVLPMIVSAAGDPSGQSIAANLKEVESGSLPVKIVVLLTLLSFIPAILLSMTCFTRLIVVFHFLRQAMGTQETPNNQILIGLALFLTLFVMSPVISKINTDALQPMMRNEINNVEALERAVVPLRTFMLKHTRERDLALFVRLSNSPQPHTADDVSTLTLIPAFIISELKTAFQIGFILFIPFLIIDMAVSSVLLSMGMMQLPPVLVSAPLKLLLFIMVDGWYLIITSLVKDLV
jgi:flagellar biosynthetic protein FliP